VDWLLRYADPTIDWDYAMVTLVVRFIGVFVVMAVIQVALQFAARLVAMVERRGAVAATSGSPPAALSIATPAPNEIDEATVAAIGAALALEARAGSAPPTPGATSSWGLAGRIQQLRRG
jgi:hypothetical protein